MFSDELERAVEFKRSSDGNIIFEIDLDGIPLGYQKEVSPSYSPAWQGFGGGCRVSC